MGQISISGGTSLLIWIAKGVSIEVIGDYRKAEEDVGLSESFEITNVKCAFCTPFDILEWADAQRGNALEKLQEMCLEKIAELGIKSLNYLDKDE